MGAKSRADVVVQWSSVERTVGRSFGHKGWRSFGHWTVTQGSKCLAQGANGFCHSRVIGRAHELSDYLVQQIEAILSAGVHLWVN